MARLSLVGLTILVVLVAVRCTQPGTPAEELAPTLESATVSLTTAPVTVTYVSYWSMSPWLNADKELAEQFQEAYPYVTIDRELTRDSQSWDDYLNAPIPPDVMTWDSAFMYPLAENRELFMDIGDLWMQQGWEDVVPEQLRMLSQSSGQYYHLPTQYSWHTFFFNKAAFNQNSLTPPETWDEFIETCAALRQAGITPIAIGLSPGEEWQAVLLLDYLNIRINGLAFRDELMLEGQVRFDDPRVRAVFATLQTLVEGGYFTEDARSQSSSDALISVFEGEAAMTLVGQDNLYLVPKTRWNELDLFRFPVIDPDVPIAETPGIDGFVIPANALGPQAAMEFLAYRGSAEAQAYWAEQCGPAGGTPVRSDIDPAVLTPDMQKAQEMLLDADELGQLIFWTDSPMVGPMFSQRYLLDFFADPGTLDEILDKMEAKRREVFGE
jgi:ABC-type glycerol-3-phosphate transport system substrate-binding protein